MSSGDTKCSCTLLAHQGQLSGHKKLESTVRDLGIEVDDALEISESIEVKSCQACNRRPVPGAEGSRVPSMLLI